MSSPIRLTVPIVRPATGALKGALLVCRFVSCLRPPPFCHRAESPQSLCQNSSGESTVSQLITPCCCGARCGLRCALPLSCECVCRVLTIAVRVEDEGEPFHASLVGFLQRSRAKCEVSRVSARLDSCVRECAMDAAVWTFLKGTDSRSKRSQALSKSSTRMQILQAATPQTVCHMHSGRSGEWNESRRHSQH